MGSRFELATPTVLLILYTSVPVHALYQARPFSCHLLTSILSLHPLLTSLLPSSPPFPPPSFSFLSPPLSLLISQVPGTSGGRRVRRWSTATDRVFSLHLKPAACQQNMYRCSTDSTFNRSDSRHVHACTVYGIKGPDLEVGRGSIS